MSGIAFRALAVRLMTISVKIVELIADGMLEARLAA
jgi:hypothetical protein